MPGLSAMNVRRRCNENGMRTKTTLNDSEIEKEVVKSIAQVITEFLKNIVRKNYVLFIKLSPNISSILQQQVPNKKFGSY